MRNRVRDAQYDTIRNEADRVRDGQCFQSKQNYRSLAVGAKTKSCVAKYGTIINERLFLSQEDTGGHRLLLRMKLPRLSTVPVKYGQP